MILVGGNQAEVVQLNVNLMHLTRGGTIVFRWWNVSQRQPPQLMTTHFLSTNGHLAKIRLALKLQSKSTPFSVRVAAGGVPPPPLDLTEDNIKLVIAEARNELGQIFDSSVGITGQVELAELDGPFVKISLKGRFWHQRSLVLARIGNYLKQRIPEILEVEIEDEKQLDDSPANF